MERETNDNRNRTAIARNDDRTSKTKAPASASATASAATATTATATATDSLDAESAVRKLLTREEECTLKTALAFVVVKTRVKAQQAASASASAPASASASTIAYAQNRTKRHRIISNEERDTESLGATNNFSVLDHLFRSEENDCDSSIGIGIDSDREHLYGYQGLRKRPKPARLLDCTMGDQNHINHMFRAAKRLSEALLVTKQKQQKKQQQHQHHHQQHHQQQQHQHHQQHHQHHHQHHHPQRSRMPDTLSISRALAGATGHLAHQLQLLLTTKTTTLPPPLASEAASAKPFEKTTTIRRRQWVASSGATACSTATPTGSRITGSNDDGDNNGDDNAAVVTPGTSNKHKPDKSKHKSKNKSKNKRKVDTIAELEGNQVNTRNDRGGRQENNDSSHINDVLTNTRDSAAFVQEWIRSTLLLQPCEYTGAVNPNDTAARHGVPARNTNTNSNSNSNTNEPTATTVLHWHDVTVLDVLASFHVYATLVPRVARISPGLAGHIARVVAKLVRDLYHDKIVVVVVSCDGDATGHGHGHGHGNARRAKRLLDHLATSALALLRVCWTTPCGSVGRTTVSATTVADRNHRSFLLLSLHELLGELLVPLPRSELAREHYKLTLLGVARERGRGRDRDRERARKNHYRYCQFGQHTQHQSPLHTRHDDGVCRGLDPEAKLLLRMAVYRLLLE